MLVTGPDMNRGHLCILKNGLDGCHLAANRCTEHLDQGGGEDQRDKTIRAGLASTDNLVPTWFKVEMSMADCSIPVTR